jgi:HlyD family secretion protein
MVMPNRNSVLLAALSLAAIVNVLPLAPTALAQEMPRAAKAEPPPDDKRWQAVAPGRIEPNSGEIKISAPVMGTIAEVLVKANDKVFAGEPLIRLTDTDAQARKATAEAQVAMRRRVRNDENASRAAATRRRAEDAVFDGEKTVVEALAAVDRAAIERRAGRMSDAELTTARATLTRAEDRLRQLRADLRRLENENNTPFPTQAEGQLNIARTELMAAEAALQKMIIRAPIDGTILQMNAKPGELASPSAPQPLVLLGDVSGLRVRAELDERDFGEIKVGQQVMVRPAAFRGREFAGAVSFIAPLVEQGRNSRGQRNATDVDVVEVLVSLSEPGPLAVGMKVDVYFRQDGPAPQEVPLRQ